MSMLDRFVNKFKKEGVDHIRIHPFAETKIGKITSKDWRQRFFVPHIGEFTSPVCFANWLCTGNDDARHNPNFRFNQTVKGYLQFVLYGKYYQLCSMKSTLAREMKDLPFIAYKQHQSGVKEFDRWKEYPAEIKDMIDHILDPNRGAKTPYNWEEKHPGLEARIKDMITAMVAEVEDKEKTAKKEVTEEVPAEVTEPDATMEEVSVNTEISEEVTQA